MPFFFWGNGFDRGFEGGKVVFCNGFPSFECVEKRLFPRSSKEGTTAERSQNGRKISHQKIHTVHVPIKKLSHVEIFFYKPSPSFEKIEFLKA